MSNDFAHELTAHDYGQTPEDSLHRSLDRALAKPAPAETPGPDGDGIAAGVGGGHSADIGALRVAGYHVMRQGTWDNHLRELAVLRSENRWLREEKEHHEKWLAGILDESRRLQDRFNRITAALAHSGVEWGVLADLLGDDEVAGS